MFSNLVPKLLEVIQQLIGVDQVELFCAVSCVRVWAVSSLIIYWLFVMASTLSLGRSLRTECSLHLYRKLTS